MPEAGGGVVRSLADQRGIHMQQSRDGRRKLDIKFTQRRAGYFKRELALDLHLLCARQCMGDDDGVQHGFVAGDFKSEFVIAQGEPGHLAGHGRGAGIARLHAGGVLRGNLP